MSGKRNRSLALMGLASATVMIAATPAAKADYVTNPNIINAAQAFSGAFPVSNVFDGVPADYASQGQGADTFIDFDFGAPTTLDGFDIINRVGLPDRVTTFDLIFSDDATFDGADTMISFSQDYTNGAAGRYTGTAATFAPQTAQYVRWDVTSTDGGASTNQGAAEIKFRSAGSSVRLAPSAVTVVASAPAFSTPQYAAVNSSDGRIGKDAFNEYASQGQGSNTFVDYDLASTQPVTGFELVQRLAAVDRPTSFDVLLSDDPTFASGVTTRSYATGDLFVSDSFAAVNARYARFDITGGTGNLGLQEMSFLVAVPEPGTFGLFAAALGGGMLRRRRRA